MKRVISTCLIIILLALFAATFYCSRKTEKVFRAQVARLKRTDPGISRLELVDYRSGLFLSQANLRIDFGAGGSMSLQHQIRHFPWGVRMITQLTEDSKLGRDLSSLVPLDQLQLLSEVDLSGKSRTSFDLPELQFSGEAAVMNLKGLHFSCDLNETLQHGYLTLGLAELGQEVNETQRLELSGLELQSRFDIQQGVPVGDGELSLSRFLVEKTGQPVLHLKNLDYRSRMQLAGKALSSTSDLSLADLVIFGERFSNGRLKVSLRGIAVAAVRDLLESLKQIQADLLSRKVDPLVLQVQLADLYRPLFRNGIDLTLEDLELQSAAGFLQGTGFLRLSGSVPANLRRIDPQQLGVFLRFDFDRKGFADGFRLFDKLQHQGEPSANPAVLNELAEQFSGGLQQKGFLTETDSGTYRLELSIEKGRGQLNGLPFSW